MDNESPQSLREQIQARELEDLKARHRDLVRTTEGDASDERRDLRKRIELIERTYWTNERLEARFKEQSDDARELTKTVSNLRIKLYSITGAFTLALGGLELYHRLIKP